MLCISALLVAVEFNITVVIAVVDVAAITADTPLGYYASVKDRFGLVEFQNTLRTCWMQT